MLTLDADTARQRYQKVYARFAAPPTGMAIDGARVLRQRGRELELLVTGKTDDVMGGCAPHRRKRLKRNR